MPSIPRPARQPQFPLHKLADLIDIDASYFSAASGYDTLTITGLSLSSNTVQAGDLYAALPGSNRHGAEFAADAIESGAVAILTDEPGKQFLDKNVPAIGDVPILVAENPRQLTGTIAARLWDHPSKKLTVIGITGTNGKTSTAYLVEHLLKTAGHHTGIIGTVETRLGDLTIESKHTTPESPDLQALFALALEQGITHMVMEVSSHALALGRVEGTHFAAVGFTMFGTDHLDFHLSLEDYFAQKAKLFDGRSPISVVNADDTWAQKLIDDNTNTFTLNSEANSESDTKGGQQYRISNITTDGYHQQFTVTTTNGEYKAVLPIPGRHNVANAVLALALVDRLAGGVPEQMAEQFQAACTALASFTGIPGRMELVNPGSEVRGIVDYAHKPEAITAVLRELKTTTRGRLIAVIGAGGNRDQQKRPLMGAAAAAEADLVIVTDDNPRTEDPATIRDAVASAVTGVECRNIPGRPVAVREAVISALAGDTIALLGKGHETYTEGPDGIVESDDRVLLHTALDDAGWGISAPSLKALNYVKSRTHNFT